MVSQDKDTSSDLTEPRISAETRPYFEVLVVDEMTAAQEQVLRDELHRLRRPEDEFVYELVVVSSFTDAVTAVLFNFNVRACVICRRFTHGSQHDLSALGVVMDERVAEEFADQSPDQRAQVLGRRAAGAHRAAARSPAAGRGDLRLARDLLVPNGTSTANKIVVQALVRPMTSCWWTATVTSPIITGWCCPVPMFVLSGCLPTQ